MKLRFLGTGDAFGSGGRFNTCFYVEHYHGAFLIDCGASSLIPMRKFGIDPNSIQAIFITHLHGEQFGGLPFLILDAQLVSRRAASLTVAGPAGLGDRLFAAREVRESRRRQLQKRWTWVAPVTLPMKSALGT
jgi:ribonuclease BN (tRNA processing enzyme)